MATYRTLQRNKETGKLRLGNIRFQGEEYAKTIAAMPGILHDAIKVVEEPFTEFEGEAVEQSPITMVLDENGDYVNDGE